jgi:hypothetical protein
MTLSKEKLRELTNSPKFLKFLTDQGLLERWDETPDEVKEEALIIVARALEHGE